MQVQLPLILAMVAAASASDPMKFTVYSEPVELRYGEVHNRNRFNPATSGFPKDVVARYADGRRLMAISGFDADMVRLNADGSESPVLLSDHYLHHYVLYFGEAKAMHKLLEFAKKDIHTHHMIHGCHAMTGAGLRHFQQEHESEAGGYSTVAFGSAAGAEYRHNPQRWEAPFRLLLRKPEVWAPTMHIINTNLADNSTQTSGPAPVSRLLECPCTPQRKIDVANGTIDGKPADPPIGCSKDFAVTGNPSCHLSTYVGGWRCCEDGVFLIDTDKECTDPRCTDKTIDKVHMKFTFYYEDAQPDTRTMESSACCDVTSSREGNMNIEYDITTCPAGTAPDRCVHVAENVQPVGYYDVPGAPHGDQLVDLVFAGPHVHWAGNSLELFDHETNEVLCSVHRSADNRGGIMYGHSSAAGDEQGYLTGLAPCIFNATKPKRFRRDHLLRSRAVYNATSYHTGVMSLWLMQVSPVPTSPSDVVV